MEGGGEQKGEGRLLRKLPNSLVAPQRTFNVDGLEFGVDGLRVWSLEFRIEGLEFSELRVWSLELRVWEFGV